MEKNKPGDFVTLAKPRISALVLMTTGCGLWLAKSLVETPSFSRVVFTLLGTVLLVGAANTLNMYLERDVDALMKRTSERPLPAKRMQPRTALVFGLFLAAISILLLYWKVNTLTASLGVMAFLSYVLFYTPLKQISILALWIGAIPGALPPLMGWTAVTSSINLPGLILFAILFLWQIPHFLAIALTHQQEYHRAGIKIMPVEKGEVATKHAIVRYMAGLVAVSLYPIWMGINNHLYFWTAILMGSGFFGLSLWGLKRSSGLRWARLFFLSSIIYLPVLLGVLAVGIKD